jgi:hypothetical protein
MCVIAIYPSVANVDFHDVRAMFAGNSHGSGFMLPHSGKVVIEKPFFKVDELIAALKGVPEKVPVIVHHRISTGGLLNAECTHPHRITPACGMAHNGIFDIQPTKALSDTALLARMLRRVASNARDFATACGMIDSMCGERNKVVFMHGDGTVVRYGKWFEMPDRILVSNMHWQGRYRPSTARKTYILPDPYRDMDSRNS